MYIFLLKSEYQIVQNPTKDKDNLFNEFLQNNGKNAPKTMLQQI